MNSDNNSDPLLVVDLDHSLLNTDILYETFWDSIKRNWLIFFKIFLLQKFSRQRLKSFLVENTSIDVKNLPYNQKLINFIKEWKLRNKNGEVVMATGSNYTIASKISSHLKLFDYVFGSDSKTNLSGKNKLSLINEKFIGRKFDYIGDSISDIIIWEESSKAILVNPKRKILKKLNDRQIDYEIISKRNFSFLAYIKLIRSYQWLKNLLIFLPVLAAHQLDSDLFLKSLIALVSFSLVSSSIYILNDLIDLESDRLHPRKSKRQLASGTIKLITAQKLFIIMLLMGFLISGLLNNLFFYALIIYFISTVIYSLFLKKYYIFDVCLLAWLYTLRIIAGAAATSIPISEWLLIFSIFIFFSLACIKRYAEIIDNKANKSFDNISGRGYQSQDASIVSQMSICSGYLSVLVLALYTTSDPVSYLYSNPNFLIGVCLILFFWINRVIMITHRGNMNDDPIIFALKDKLSYLCFILVSVFVYFAII